MFIGNGGSNTLDYSWDTTPIPIYVQKINGRLTGFADKGVSNGVDQSDDFYDVQNFKGGSKNDSFVISAGTEANLSFDGGGGDKNTLDYSAYGWDITVDIRQGTVTKGSTWTDDFVKVQSFIGGFRDDTFISDYNGSYWFDGGSWLTNGNTASYALCWGAITVDVGQGTVSKYLISSSSPDGGIDHLSNVQNFIGGTNNDTFKSAPGDYSFDGGGGTTGNTLDYSWDDKGITADLGAGTVSKGAGYGTDQFSNIQKFIGGSKNDVFYGRSGTYTFDGGTGLNTLDYSSGNNAFHVTGE
jgi:hypothetical protein